MVKYIVYSENGYNFQRKSIDTICFYYALKISKTTTSIFNMHIVNHAMTP